MEVKIAEKYKVEKNVLMKNAEMLMDPDVMIDVKALPPGYEYIGYYSDSKFIERYLNKLLVNNKVGFPEAFFESIRYKDEYFYDDEGLMIGHNRHIFLFDQSNEEYLILMQDYVKRRKKLTQILKTIFKTHDANIINEYRKRKSHEKDYQRMHFLFAPMQSSSYTMNIEKRKQNIRNSIQFVFHFDNTNKLDAVRTWQNLSLINGDDPEIVFARNMLQSCLKQSSAIIEKNFVENNMEQLGNHIWEIIKMCNEKYNLHFTWKNEWK